MLVVSSPSTSSVRLARQAGARARLRRRDLWIGTTAMIAALLALPLSPASHSPEAAAMLAVSATALLAGHRWAVALVVLSELLLVPALLPRLWVTPPDVAAHVAIGLASVSAIPGILALRRAAAAMVLIAGVRRTARSCRVATVLMVATAVASMTLGVS